MPLWGHGRRLVQTLRCCHKLLCTISQALRTHSYEEGSLTERGHPYAGSDMGDLARACRNVKGAI